jgi:hypothetical protein
LANHSPLDPGLDNSSTDDDVIVPQWDFDSGANDLWALYEKETKDRDVDKFKSLKDDMNSVFLLVRSYFVHAYIRQ